MPRLAANLSMLFTEVDFLARFEAAANAGFQAVEFQSPYEYDKRDIADKLREHGLALALHNLPAGDWEAGERGLACLPDRVDEFRESVALAAEYASTLGALQVNCLAGIAPPDAPTQALRETFVANLRYAADKLAEVGVGVVTEPINTMDIPGFYLNYSAQARSIIEEVGSDNLALQHDVYHMQIMEGDLARGIRANLDIIRHVQIADNPGRNEPGTGEINYPYVLGALDDAGYQGWVGCEYRPLTTTQEGLGWAAPYLGRG